MMIHTDGTLTIATAPRRAASERIRAGRKRAAILRAFYSAQSAYPDAPFSFQVAQAAKASRVSGRIVAQVVVA